MAGWVGGTRGFISTRPLKTSRITLSSISPCRLGAGFAPDPTCLGSQVLSSGLDGTSAPAGGELALLPIHLPGIAGTWISSFYLNCFSVENGISLKTARVLRHFRNFSL